MSIIPGSRKGSPYTRKYIQSSLNKLAIDKNIVDEQGCIYHFKNHAFRHTYAVKLLNNGVDIYTIKEILAHLSPEMTITYARLLDEVKREEFDKVVKKGVFHFDKKDEIIQNNEDIPEDILEALYINHKLSAINVPYGTCMQRTKGKCPYAKLPPCLTRNNGSPCKDLCIGASDDDINKYSILIDSTKNLIASARVNNRTEIVEANEELLERLVNIKCTISKGDIIYGNIARLKKEVIKDE